MAGDLNAKHVDWNSRLTPRREKSLREYASENTCQNFGTDTPSSNPFNPSATPDVLDIAVTQGGLITPVLFSLYVNDIPSPSHHIKLAL